MYAELRKLAAHHLAAEKPGQTLQATALVHEAYLRLVGDQHFTGRGHFFAAAAEAMRRILIEQARKRRTQRHGGGRDRVPLEQADVAAPEPSLAVLALNQLLPSLGKPFEALPPEIQRWIQTVTVIAGGGTFIVTSLLWATSLSHLIDGRVKAASAAGPQSLSA